MKKDLDRILKQALTPQEEPDAWLNQNILYRAEEMANMKKKKKTNMDVQCPLLKKYKVHKKSFTSKSGTKSMLDILFKTRSH